MIPASMTGRLRWCGTCRSPFRSDFNRCPIDGAEIIDTETDLLLGQTLGKHYVIDSLIGEGSMARVYRAHHAQLPHKQFAVKVLIGDLTGTLEMRLRFAQEADAASQLEHPHVVSVVDFGKTDGGLMFLAMELCEGRSLGTLVGEDGPLPATRALALARQIALGLGHAHDKGLIHRDLKPDNIIVVAGTPERARIVDFGLAIPLDEERAARLTHVGLMVGTPVYAAPEQTHNEAVDHRADLFALGVTLYEMLAGVTPYQGSLALLVRANASDVLVPIAARSGVAVPEPVEDLVRRLMRRDPAQRFQNAREVVEAIDAIGEERAAVAVSVVALPVARPRRLWLALSAGALAIAAVIVFAVATHESAAPVPRPVVAASPPAPLVAEPPAPIEQAPPLAVATIPQVTKPTVKTSPKPKPKPVAIEVAVPLPPPPEVVAPVIPEPAAPRPVAPPPPVVVEPARPPPVWTTATASLAAIDVRGPLPAADVRRAIEKGLPAFAACYQRSARAANRSPRTSVRLTLSFDDSRHAIAVVARAASWAELATCIHTAAEELRVANAPDVGTADVIADVLFTPVAP